MSLPSPFVRSLALALTVSAAPLAHGQAVFDDYEGGVSTTEFFWVDPTLQVIDAFLGNPDGGLVGIYDTTQSSGYELRAQAAEPSPLVGDWRARGVTTFSFDVLVAEIIAPPGPSWDGSYGGVALEGADGSVFFDFPLTLSGVPAWETIAVAVDGGSPTVPAGWSGGSDADWVALMSDVELVSVWFGDPLDDDGWYEGYLDNVGTDATPSVDLGGALAGTAGIATLTAGGTLVGGEPLTFWLDGALPGGSATLVIGLTELSVPFKGGVLVPAPDLLIGGLPLDGDGRLTLTDTWPTGLPSGIASVWQVWFADAAGPVGLAASNGLELTTP